MAATGDRATIVAAKTITAATASTAAATETAATATTAGYRLPHQSARNRRSRQRQQLQHSTADYCPKTEVSMTQATVMASRNGEPDWCRYKGRPEELIRAVCAWLMTTAAPQAEYASDPHARIAAGEERLTKLVHILSAAGVEAGTNATEMHIDRFCAWLQACYFDGISTKEHGPQARRRARHNNSIIEQLCSQQQFGDLAAKLSVKSIGAAAAIVEAHAVAQQLAELQVRLAEARAEGHQLATLLTQIKRRERTPLGDVDDRRDGDGEDQDFGLAALWQEEEPISSTCVATGNTAIEEQNKEQKAEEGCIETQPSAQESIVKTIVPVDVRPEKMKAEVDAKDVERSMERPRDPLPTPTSALDCTSSMITSLAASALLQELTSLLEHYHDVQRQYQLKLVHQQRRRALKQQQQLLQKWRQRQQEQKYAQEWQRRARLAAAAVAQRKAATQLHLSQAIRHHQQQQRQQKQLHIERTYGTAVAELLGSCRLGGQPVAPLHMQQNCGRQRLWQWQTTAPVSRKFAFSAPTIIC